MLARQGRQQRWQAGKGSHCLAVVQLGAAVGGAEAGAEDREDLAAQGLRHGALHRG